MNRRDKRHLFIHDGNQTISIKGLSSQSIKELPLTVRTSKGISEPIHAIEMYTKQNDQTISPLIAVDIVSNCYFRQTYLCPHFGSATLGTSSVGTCSFRTENNMLHFIPTVNAASLECSELIRVQLTAAFENYAEIESTRTYPTHYKDPQTSMEISITFKALKNINLFSQLLGQDSFRFFTISSMYSNAKRYDSNVIQVIGPESKSYQYPLIEDSARGCYLLPENFETVHSLTALKTNGSMGKRGTPGSPDSPSIEVQVLEVSPSVVLTPQAYLSESRNFNEDSLSIWLEWKNAPACIIAGTQISIRLKVTAFGV